MFTHHGKQKNKWETEGARARADAHTVPLPCDMHKAKDIACLAQKVIIDKFHETATDVPHVRTGTP